MSKSNQFRIDVAAFLRETSRLGPTVVGAYVNIMLDYFEQGEPPPDDDAVLARIVGCDPSLWADIRLKLEHLFEIRDGRWYHAHCESEIAAASRRVKRSKAAATAAGEVHSARAAEPVRKSIVDLISMSERPDPLPMVQVERPPEPEPDDDDEDTEIEPPVPQPKGITFEGPLPEDFKPAAAEISERLNEGYTSQQVADVLDGFRRYHLAAATMSNNWPELERRWWNRKKPPLHPAEKAAPKPRIVLSRRPPPPPSE